MNLERILNVLKEVPTLHHIQHGSDWVCFKVADQQDLKYITDRDDVRYNLIHKALYINNETILVR